MKKTIFTVLIVAIIFTLRVDTVFAQTDFSSYIDNPPITSTITPGKVTTQDELNRIIGEVISMGHMAPTLYNAGLGQTGLIYYHGPSETIHILSEAYPYVSSALKPQLLSYLQNEIATYPPHSTAMYDNKYSGAITVFKGSRREYFPYDSTLTFNVWPPPTVPKSVLYSIWAYSHYTENWSYAQANYTALKDIFTQIQSSGIITYGEFSGVIGFGRIAKHFNNTADYNSAVSLVNNSGATNFSAYLTTAETTYPNTSHKYQTVLFQFGSVSRSFHFNADIGKFLKENAQAGASGYANKLCTDVPLCWLTSSGLSHGENAYTLPEVSWTYFLIQAYINNKNTLELQNLLDRPDRRGDLFYIQKLIATLQAPDTLSTTPTPSTCPTDLNGDNLTDLSDYSILANNFFSTSPSNPKADINSDGLVDLTDYSQIANQFLKACN